MIIRHYYVILLCVVGEYMQIQRLFEIIYLLLEQEIVSAKKLAERFEVSTRTIYCDVEILSSSGIPIFMKKGRNGGISLMPNFKLNKTVMTKEEKNVIISALDVTKGRGL